MTETIAWDSDDAEEDTAKKTVLIEEPVIERTTLSRLDEEIAMMDRDIAWATSRKNDLVAKRDRIVASLHISTKDRQKYK